MIIYVHRLYCTLNKIYYYFYEFTKTLFEKTSRNSTLTTSQSMTAGALAGIKDISFKAAIVLATLKINETRNRVLQFELFNLVNFFFGII